jgi:hypothetical protein
MLSPRIRRIIVGASITALSVAAGAFSGFLVAITLDVASGGFFHRPLDGDFYLFGANVGGVLGAVLGPAAAFGFLRRVPIGRLFGQTIVGTALGGLAGLWLGETVYRIGDGFYMIIGGGVLGFSIAAARLWWRSRQLVTRSTADLP